MPLSESVSQQDILDQTKPFVTSLHGRLLLATEEVAVGERLRDVMTQVGTEVILVRTESEVLESLSTETPDLLLLDMSPAFPNIEKIIRQIKSDDALRYLPVLVFLATDQEPSCALDAGADDFLRHIVHPGELILRVKMLLRLSRLHHDLLDNNSELQAAYETARESEAKYRALIYDAQDALVLVDPETSSILEVNRRACALSGYASDDLLGEPVTLLCESGPTSRWPELRDELMATNRAALDDSTMRLKDGEVIPIEVSASLASHHLGKPLIQILMRDIRPRLQLEDERNKSERLSAVVETAVTVNHEINNPLLVITSSVENLQRALFHADSGVREKLDRINEACSRIQRFTQQLASVIAPVTKEYLPGLKMLDIRQSVASQDDTSP